VPPTTIGDALAISTAKLVPAALRCRIVIFDLKLIKSYSCITSILCCQLRIRLRRILIVAANHRFAAQMSLDARIVTVHY